MLFFHLFFSSLPEATAQPDGAEGAKGATYQGARSQQCETVSEGFSGSFSAVSTILCALSWIEKCGGEGGGDKAYDAEFELA